MIMPPMLRKTVLTVHVVTSVGLLGAVTAYVALDVTTEATEKLTRVLEAFVKTFA